MCINLIRFSHVILAANQNALSKLSKADRFCSFYGQYLLSLRGYSDSQFKSPQPGILKCAQNNNERGAVLPEFSLAASLWLLIFGFAIDSGLFLYTSSDLYHSTNKLSRHLASEIGEAWSSGKILEAPWLGSCEDLIVSRGNNYLATHAANGSLNDSGAAFDFGSTLRDHSILRPDPHLPYTMLTIIGSAKSYSLASYLFDDGVITVESSVLVEFSDEKCLDF